MDKDFSVKKKRFHILFFVFKRGEKDGNDTDDTCYKKKIKTSNKRIGKWLALLTVFLFTILVIYPKAKLQLLHDLPQRLTDYFSYRSNSSLTEVRHVGFLKVHKAGGSTIQNILFRFGMKRNLSFVMPVTAYKFSDYGKRHNKLLNHTFGAHYDILALHSVYDETLYSKLLPSDTVNIAIVRDPLELMISAAYYHRDVWEMGYLKRVPEDQYIRKLILYPELYDQNQLSWTRNSMAMDFGFKRGYNVGESTRLEEYLKYLNSKFDLVMVMEYFDESLILLKRILKWELSDILYIPLNSYKHPNIKDVNISSSDIRKFELRNFLDVAIYKFFSGIYFEKVEDAGTDFVNEVKQFKNVMAEVRNFCRDNHTVRASLLIQESLWNKEFTVSHADCKIMLIPELRFIDKIRDKIKLSMKIL